MKFRIVCATREPREQFGTKTALGRSLALYPFPFVDVRVFPNNSAGLPTVYNTILRESALDPAILIFIHDDVHLLDLYWPDRIVQGLNEFDIIGVTGNTRRVPQQPSWRYLDDKFTRDDAQHLSGAIAHGSGWPAAQVSYYGIIGRAVKLLDGVMLAARSETLLSRNVLFDEAFNFHFYDLDFCRQAERQQLRMGTWPIPIVHESGGSLGAPGWRQAYAQYLAKWQS
ncbi:MAG: glycosyltransferase [Steroidobacteraceae bacterium]